MDRLDDHIIMSKFIKRNARSGYASGDDNASDIISELSNDETASLTSNTSKSSAFRYRMSRFGKKKRKKDSASSSGATSSLGSTSKSDSQPATYKVTVPSTRPHAVSPPGSVSSASRRSKHANQSEEMRLKKDAKSRFNIGLVYLKTGDYAKAQDNLEHSLYCHVQLAGHNPKLYTNQSLYQIASVREKLGDCYLSNTACVDKGLAVDHLEEAKRLLASVHPEDAPDNVKEMLERVNEKLKLPELNLSGIARKRPQPPVVKKYEIRGNLKAKKTLGIVATTTTTTTAAAANSGRGGGVVAAAPISPPSSPSGKRGLIEKLGHNIEKLGKEVGTGITGVGLGIRSGFEEILGLDDDSDVESTCELKSSIRKMQGEEVS